MASALLSEHSSRRKHLLGDFGNTHRPLVSSPLKGEMNVRRANSLSASLQFRITLATIGLVLMTSVYVSAARAQQKVLTNDEIQIVDTVNSMFTVLQTDDASKLNSILAPDFYMFDGGHRFNGEAIMAQIRALQETGKRFEWCVTDPDVHISGNTAWIAYVNEGSITDASGRVSQQWLESAFLEKQAGIWKIRFLHSTRVPKPQETRE
jgi:ketosteroid isomerase-like protein